MSFKIIKLGEACNLQNGFAFKSKFFTEDGLPILRISNIQNQIINIKKIVYFKLEKYKEKLDKYIVEHNDLLIAMSGATTGKIGFNNTDQRFYLNQRVGNLKPKEILDKKYLYYFLSTQIEKNLKISLGAAQPNLSTEQILNILIPLPPLPIQHKIVEKLDAIFAEIDKASASVEANVKNTKLYIGKFSDEIIHEKLEKYKELTLNDITEVITCGVAKRPEYVDSGIPFLSARNVKNGKMKWDRHEFVSEETHNTLSKHNKPKIGDILYSRVGAGFGDAAIIDKDIEFSIFVSLTLLKIKPVILNEFLCYYLNSPFIKEVARKNITGTGVGNLNVGAVRLFKIKLPDLKIQNEIVKKLNYINQNGKILIESYLKKLEQLSLLKQSILKQAFNGELIKAA